MAAIGAQRSPGSVDGDGSCCPGTEVEAYNPST